MQIIDIINQDTHAISAEDFIVGCRKILDDTGVLVLADFIHPDAVETMPKEVAEGQSKAYLCVQTTQSTLHRTTQTNPTITLPTIKSCHQRAASLTTVSPPSHHCAHSTTVKTSATSSRKPPGKGPCTPTPTHCPLSTSTMQDAGKNSAGTSTIRPSRSRC